MKRFSEVTPNILRGGAPSKDEIRALKDLWGVNRIISLDLEEGEKIEKECKDLGIEHLIIPLEHDSDYFTEKSLDHVADFIATNVVSLLEEHPVTFVHCIHGRDRTGYVIALWRIKGEGWTPKAALQEALSFGFGHGISEVHRAFFVRELEKATPDDRSDANDIAGKVRESFDRGSVTGPSDGSNIFSPITPVQDLVQSYPISPTRDVAQVDDSRARRRKMRMKYLQNTLQDKNDSMANVGINDNINPMLRGISPEGIGPLGIMPYGNYYL